MVDFDVEPQAKVIKLRREFASIEKNGTSSE
jgi:hypothetical protein